ncbi:MAG: glycine hydroxymethyltransferase [Candidatus Berkelbacteria bacterium Gr01-1014_85]|uniref:Serine hydroxymethyltransferase n=1 Tax=Candidatus Berkelbacteria bacterium Gr01-1014_85 TaxID=2017150 RepID=A0A554JCP7_9BACT|nr:MAG: glycine hydroxymethyltransferase [Candidatus Berkelbacteria bacterium Gr01-1014_85]
MDKIFDLISAEATRQEHGLEMIPSENYVSEAVLAANGSILTNKYAEGYPGARYYHGNEVIDQIEELAIKRAKAVFKTDYTVNVQPYSGSPANAACLMAVLKPKDKVLGLALNHGGHITHGLSKALIGRFYQPLPYHLDPVSHRLDYAAIRRLAQSERPKLIISGATAYPRQIDWSAIQAIADEVGALHLADISHVAGLIAGGVHPSPFELADLVMTTTHKTLRGPRGAMIFSRTPALAKKIDSAVFPGLQGGPHEHTIAAIAVALAEATEPSFTKYAEQIIDNTQALIKGLHRINPELRLVTGGSDNHLILIDTRSVGLTGQDAADRLHSLQITVNQNTVPDETGSARQPSGIRLGTPALTTRGFGTLELESIGQIIATTLSQELTTEVSQNLAMQIKELTTAFPLAKPNS